MAAPIAYIIAGMLDRLDKRDAAAAQQKADENKARAEKDMYAWQKDYDALIADHKAQMDRIAKDDEYNTNMSRARTFAQAKAQATGNSAYVINPVTFESEFFSRGETGWENREDVEKIIGPLNKDFETNKYTERYRVIPHASNPERFTFEQFTPEKPKQTFKEFKQSITDAGLNVDDFELTIGENNKFSAKQKGKPDNTPRTRAEAENQAEQIRTWAKTNKLVGTVTLKEAKDIGWTAVWTEGAPDKDAIDPDKISTKYGDSKIPYGHRYWFHVAGYDDKSILDKRPTIFDLTPNGTLNILGNNKDNPRQQDEFEYGRDVLVWSPPAYDGSVNNAVQGLRSFFGTFRKDTIRSIVNNKRTNPTTYKDLRETLQGLSYNFTYATKLQTNEFIRLSDPAQAGVFPQNLQDLVDIGDLGLIQSMDSGYNTAVRQSNAEVGLPANTEAAVQPDGSRVIAKRPAIKASSLVERDQDGTPYWTADFQRTVSKATASGVVTQSQVLDIVSAAKMPNADIKEMGSPEAVAYGAEQLETLADLFAGAMPQPTKQTATVLGNALYTAPKFGSMGKAKLVKALAPWITIEDQLLALESAIPKHKLELLSGGKSVGRGSENRNMYELSGATMEWTKLGEEGENARKTLETVKQTKDLLNAGARTGLLSEFEKAKAAVNYFFGEATEIIRGEDGVERRVNVVPIGVDEDITVTMNDGTTRSYTSRATIRADLEARLQRINSEPVFDEDSAQRRKDALLAFNLTVLSYSYAAMLDPNGRLSDADREQADRAIGNSIWSTPSQIEEVANEIESRANYIRQRALAWRGGVPSRIMAMTILDSNSDLLPQAVPVQTIIRAHLTRRNIVEGAQASGGAGVNAGDIASELSGELGGGTGNAQPSVPSPRPRPNAQIQLF